MKNNYKKEKKRIVCQTNIVRFLTGTLRKKKRDEEWDKFFSSSHSVHFFQSSHTGGDKIMRPKNYGRDRPAMLYLALNHCPAAYYAQRIF